MFCQGLVGENVLPNICHLSSNVALCTKHSFLFFSSLYDQEPKCQLHKDQSLKVSMDLLKLIPAQEEL